jgi:curved DNA-binding protein CbpA
VTTQVKDYYALLGLTQDATLAAIKKAYRRLARQHHPDKNPGDPNAAERFRDLTEAYDTLTNPARREVYDATYQPAPGTGVTPPAPDSYVISRVLAVLEDIWAAIRARHPEIPAVVLIIASGTEGRQRLWGHHAPNRWVAGTQARAEIMISGEGLQRGSRPILGTLLHEAAHALAAARDIQDTSRQGRYHNKHFKTLAAELGITVEFDKTIGWSPTTLPDETAAAYKQQLAALDDALTLWRLDETLTTTTTGRRSTNLVAATCPCGRRIRVAASTLAEAPITCGECDGDFQSDAPSDI